MLRKLIPAALSSLCFALIASATPALAQQAPAIHVGSDTRAKPEAQCLSDAQFAITETGLAVSFTTNINVGSAGNLRGAGVGVLVTCLPQGARTLSKWSARAWIAVQQRKPATGFGPSRWVRRAEVSRAAKARPGPVVAATNDGRAGHSAGATVTLHADAAEVQHETC